MSKSRSFGGQKPNRRQQASCAGPEVSRGGTLDPMLLACAFGG